VWYFQPGCAELFSSPEVAGAELLQIKVLQVLLPTNYHIKHIFLFLGVGGVFIWIL
jgi:hypothetical protein